MKKVIIIIAVVIAAATIVFGIMFFNAKTTPKSNFDTIGSADELSTIIDNIYANLELELPMLQTQILDITDTETLTYMTGLENTSNIEFAVVSEPMMSSQAYSLVVLKVKDGNSADEVAKYMCENIDNRKWICVTADKVYSTSSGNIAFLVMSSEDRAKPVYDKFKELAGGIGQEYQRAEEISEEPVDDLEVSPIEEGTLTEIY